MIFLSHFNFIYISLYNLIWAIISSNAHVKIFL